MKLILFIFLSLTTINAFAVSAVGGCLGRYQGIDIKLHGVISDKSNLDSAEGSVIIAGREVARFNGADLRYNIILMTFKARNYQGDIIEGKVKSISEKSAVFSRLYVPAFGIDLRNVFVTCWNK